MYSIEKNMDAHNNEFEQLIHNVSEMCEGMYLWESHCFSQLYPFTTENIAGYIDFFDLTNKSLLTVGSSLDQTFNAILSGAKDISVLDINPYTRFYFYFKLSSILTLPFDEFSKYFCYKDYPSVFTDNQEVFNLKTYDKIKDTLRTLDYESYLFWDQLFGNYEPLLIRKKMFSLDEYRLSLLREMNSYMKNEQDYNKLRKMFADASVKIMCGDICQENLSSKYDNIWLSNVCQYQPSRKPVIDLLDKYKELLNDNGKLLLCYLYQTPSLNQYNDAWAPIYDLDSLFKELPNSELEVMSFKGVKGILFDSENMRDSVLVYQKK